MPNHTAGNLSLEGDQTDTTFLPSSWKSEEVMGVLKASAVLGVSHPVAYQEKIVPETESACSTLASDLDSFLTQCGLGTYIPYFKQQEVDLPIFLCLTDKDLLECGVTKFGPRRKMVQAINRWFSNTPPVTRGREAAYVQKLEVETELLKRQLTEWKEKQHQGTLLVREMKIRLDECHSRSFLVKDGLSTVINFASILSLPQLSSQLTLVSTCFEDICNKSTSPVFSTTIV